MPRKRNSTMIDESNRFESITLGEYLKRLRQYKWYFHKYFKANHLHGPYVNELTAKGAHLLYAYAALATDQDYVNPVGDQEGSMRKITLDSRDRLIMGQKLVLVYDADLGAFKICHQIDDTQAVKSLNEYIDEIQTGLDYRAFSPLDKIELDKSNPVILRIWGRRHDLATQVGHEIALTRNTNKELISRFDILSILNEVSHMTKKSNLRHIRKQVKKKEE